MQGGVLYPQKLHSPFPRGREEVGYGIRLHTSETPQESVRASCASRQTRLFAGSVAAGARGDSHSVR